MAVQYTINYSVKRMYQQKGGKLVDGYETEFFEPEFGTTQSVLTPTGDAATVAKAINDRITELRAVHALGG